MDRDRDMLRGVDWFFDGYITTWFQKSHAGGRLGAHLHILVVQRAWSVGNQNFAQRHILADGIIGYDPLTINIALAFDVLVTGDFISICPGLV